MIKDRKNTTKKMSLCAIMVSLALIFSYVEVLIPISLGVPGIKLGLANIIVLIAAYYEGYKDAAIINLARILLSAMLFGNAFSLIYALSGALLSFGILIVFKELKIFSIIGVSMAMGVFHNFGQLVAAMVVLRSVKIIGYFPVLLIAGIITGILTGYLAYLILRAIKNVKI